MKNQFFGDNRDLFKYDLIQHIIQGIKEIDKFSFVPMLTRNSGTHGNQVERQKAKAGKYNYNLINYLDKCILENRRNITEIIKYYKQIGISTFIYRESTYFVKSLRRDYFNSIPESFLKNSLILVYPDNILQVKKSKEEHFLYIDIKKLYDSMNDNASLMIFQYFPRECHDNYTAKRRDELFNITKEVPSIISDNVIMYLFLTKKIILNNIC